MSREDRVHLSRLRCGHHPALPSYMNRIGRAPSADCVLCQAEPGTVEHVLLHCPTLQEARAYHNITSLEHLWTRPTDVMDFLRSTGVL